MLALRSQCEIKNRRGIKIEFLILTQLYWYRMIQVYPAIFEI